MLSKTMLWVIIGLIIGIFLGTWVFDIFAFVFNGIGTMFHWLSVVFNFFGFPSIL